MADVIDRFTNSYAFLSNFYVYNVYFRRRFYQSAEHAFQSMKARSRADAEWVRSAPNPNQAKTRGNQLDKRPDWDEIRLLVMEDVVRAKFREDDVLATRLRDTGSALLIEGNTWGDTYWGKAEPLMIGENHLGKILMKVRWELERGRGH